MDEILQQQDVKDLLSVLFDLLEQKTGNRYTAKVQNNKIVLSRNDGKFYIFKSFDNTYFTVDGRWSKDKTKAKLFNMKCNAINAIEYYLVSNYQLHFDFQCEFWSKWDAFYAWLRMVRPIIGYYHRQAVHNLPLYNSQASEQNLGSEFVSYYKEFCTLLDELNTITVRNLADDNS